MKQDQELIKQNNIKLLLSTLLEERPISRVELAKKINMSPTSITRITSLLIASGLVVETDIKSAGVGRHAIMLDTVASGAYSLGIDIKSWVIRFSIVNLQKESIAIHSVRCDVPSLPLSDLCEIIYNSGAEFLRENNIPYKKVIGIGVSIPGIVDMSSYVVELSTQLRWKNQDILPHLSRLFKKPIIIENDTKSRIIGEKSLNNVPDGLDVAMLIIGNGVSAAAISRGKIVRGVRNAAGEIGHILIEPDGIVCDCGVKGCIQTRLSDKFLIQTAREHDPTVLDMNDIVAAYHENNQWAVDMINHFKKVFHLSLDIIKSCYNPAVIIVSGTVVEYMEPFLNEASQLFTTSKNCEVKIVISATKKNVAAIGSAIISSNTFIHTLLFNS